MCPGGDVFGVGIGIEDVGVGTTGVGVVGVGAIFWNDQLTRKLFHSHFGLVNTHL